MFTKFSKSNKISSKDIINDKYQIKKKNIRLENSVSRNVSGLDTILSIIKRNNLKHKRIATALIESENQYRRLFETAIEGILILNYDSGKIVDVNPFLKNLLGYTKEQFIKKEIWEIDFLKDIVANKEKFIELQQTECVRYEDLTLQTSAGLAIHVEFVSNVYLVNNQKVIQCKIRDITEKKQFEKILFESETVNKTLIEHLPQKIFLKDINSVYISCNTNYAASLGIHREEISGKNDFDYFPQELADAYRLDDKEVINNDITKDIVEKYFQNGEYRWIHTTKVPFRNSKNNIIGVLGVFEDITEWKTSEENFIKLSRVNKVLSNINKEIVRIRNVDKLFEKVCEIAEKDGNFLAAWIGVNNYETNEIEIFYPFKKIEIFPCIKDIEIDKVIQSGIPMGRAINSGLHCFSQNIENDVCMNDCREIANIHGIKSTISLVLKTFGQIYGTFNLFSNEIGFFDDEEIKVLDEVACDISFALEFIQIETKNKIAESSLIASEVRYRRLFETAKDGILILEAGSGRIVDVNPFLIKLLGFTKEQFFEKEIWDIGFFKDIFANKEKFVELQEKEYVRYDDLPLETSSGRNISVEFVSNVYLVNGKKVIQCNIRDITSRKEYEKFINELSTRNNAILESVPDIIMETDNNQIYTWANKAGYEYFGEDVIGKNAHFYFEGEQETIQKIQPLFKGNENILYIESKQRRQDGEKRILAWWCKVLKDENNNVLGALSTARDITESKKADKALEKAYQELESLHNNLDEAVFAVDIIQNKMIQVSIAHKTIFGYSPDEFFANSQLWYDIIVDEDKAIVDSGYPTLLSGNNLRHEYRINHGDGTIRWIEVKITPTLDNTKKLISINGIASDITVRKRSEELITENRIMLELAMQSAKMAWWEMDIVTGNINFDKRKAEMIGYTSDKFKHYKDFTDLLHPDDYEKTMNAMRSHFSGTVNKYEAEYRILTKTGEYKWFYDIGSILKRDKNNIPMSVTGLVIDISERKIVEHELIISKEKAEESDKLKTAFLQNMSHEIRTPLNGIIGFSNLLNNENLSKEDILEFTEIINQSGNRLLEIVNNVLDISKIQTGQVQIDKKIIVINSVLSDLFTFFSHLAKDKNISLNYSNQTDKNRTLYSDETKLNQILTNLINNAIKFTKIGSINFGYDIKEDVIEFFVTDTGIGIAPEMYDSIFDRFIQAEHTINRRYEGAGLGLAICKGLVELLGGIIWVKSEQNKGTTFFFTLPYNHETQNYQIEQVFPEILDKITQGKILIAEDDWTSSQYLKRLLSNADVTVIHAENGEEAVQFVKDIPDIDLILMDIRMPIMDGIEATKLIKEIRPDLPIIAQTAYAFSEEKKRILDLGCDEYLSKPINGYKLNSLIKKYLNK